MNLLDENASFFANLRKRAEMTPSRASTSPGSHWSLYSRGEATPVSARSARSSRTASPEGAALGAAESAAEGAGEEAGAGTGEEGSEFRLTPEVAAAVRKLSENFMGEYPTVPEVLKTKPRLKISVPLFTDQLLGAGGYGRVYGWQRALATKVSKPSSSIFREVASLIVLKNSPFVITLFKAQLRREERDGKAPKAMLTVAKAPDTLEGLFSRARKDESLSISIAWNLLNAVWDIHRHGLLHRDLKPGNVVAFADQKKTLLQVIDFGLATIVPAWSGALMSPLAYTEGYRSPLLQNASCEGKTLYYDWSQDLYAIGSTLAELKAGVLPRTPRCGEENLLLASTLAQKRWGEVIKTSSAEWSTLVGYLLGYDISKIPMEQGDLATWVRGALESKNVNTGTALSHPIFKSQLATESLSAFADSPRICSFVPAFVRQRGGVESKTGKLDKLCQGEIPDTTDPDAWVPHLRYLDSQPALQLIEDSTLQSKWAALRKQLLETDFPQSEQTPLALEVYGMALRLFYNSFAYYTEGMEWETALAHTQMMYNLESKFDPATMMNMYNTYKGELIPANTVRMLLIDSENDYPSTESLYMLAKAMIDLPLQAYHPLDVAHALAQYNAPKKAREENMPAVSLALTRDFAAAMKNAENMQFADRFLGTID